MWFTSGVILFINLGKGVAKSCFFKSHQVVLYIGRRTKIPITKQLIKKERCETGALLLLFTISFQKQIFTLWLTPEKVCPLKRVSEGLCLCDNLAATRQTHQSQLKGAAGRMGGMGMETGKLQLHLKKKRQKSET